MKTIYRHGLFSLAALTMIGLSQSAAAMSVRDADSAPTEDRSRDLTQVELFRTPENGPAFRVRFAAPPAADCLRILIDVDPEKGEPASGADFMLEGDRFYRYPQGVSDWTWDSIEPPIIVSDDRALLCVLPALDELSRGRWIVETIDADWNTVDRVPQRGGIAFALANVPPLSMEPPAPGVDLLPLLENSPRSLSFLIDARVKELPWQAVPPDQPMDMSWQTVCMEKPLPLKLVLADAASGQSTELKPDEASTAGDVARWNGRALDVDWTVLAEPDSAGDLIVTAYLQADEDRCLNLKIGAQLDLSGWTWRRNVWEQDDIEGEVVSQNLYPFGVISRARGVLVAETDPNEPRFFRTIADPAAGFFGVVYDVALTSQTSNFPGRAACRMALRSDSQGEMQAFRRVLWGFLERNRHFKNGQKVSAAPLAMPPQRPDAIAPLRIDPGLCMVTIPPGLPVTSKEAARLLGYHSLGASVQGELAAAASMGASCFPDGSKRVFLRDAERSAIVEMCADPDLRVGSQTPVSPAMAAWRKTIGAKHVSIGSLSDLRSIDYNPAAIAAADHPCVFEQDYMKPGVATEFSAYEFVASFSAKARETNRSLLGLDACAKSPFFAGLFDAFIDRVGDVGEEELDFRRAIAGAKPYVLALDLPLSQMTPAAVERHLRRCMARGFVPGFGADYWSDSSLPARDASLLNTFLPIATRLAQEGWDPLGPVQSLDEDCRSENFGAGSIRHVSVRNMSDGPLRSQLVLPAANEPRIVLDPLSGGCDVYSPADASFAVALTGGEIGVRDLFPLSAIDGQLAFLNAWRSGGDEAASCRTSLESIRRELDRGLYCNLLWPTPAVRGEINEVTLRIDNRGKNTAALTDMKIISSRHFRPVEIEPMSIAPGRWGSIHAVFEERDARDNPWLEVQWTLELDGQKLVCSRVYKPQWIDPLVFKLVPPVQVAGDFAHAHLDVRNYSRRTRVVDLRWRGDFKGGRDRIAVQAGAVARVKLEMVRGRRAAGRMTVEATSEFESLLKEQFEVDFGKQE